MGPKETHFEFILNITSNVLFLLLTKNRLSLGVGKENKIFIKILKGPNGTIGLPSLSFPLFLMILMVIIKMVIVNIVMMILIRL